MDDVDEAERRRLRKLWRKYHAEHEEVAAECLPGCISIMPGYHAGDSWLEQSSAF